MVLYKPLRLHQGQGLGSLHRRSNSPGHIRCHLPRCSTPRSWQENCYDRSSLLDRPRCGVAWADGDSTVWGFRADNPLLPLSNPNQLVIDSSLFFASLIVATALAYGFVYA